MLNDYKHGLNLFIDLIIDKFEWVLSSLSCWGKRDELKSRSRLCCGSKEAKGSIGGPQGL